MDHLNMHKAPGWSQLSKTDTGALKRNSHHKAQHDAPDQTMPHGTKWKTGRPNLPKAPVWSQLRKTDTGALE